MLYQIIEMEILLQSCFQRMEDENLGRIDSQKIFGGFLVKQHDRRYSEFLERLCLHLADFEALKNEPGDLLWLQTHENAFEHQHQFLESNQFYSLLFR